MHTLILSFALALVQVVLATGSSSSSQPVEDCISRECKEILVNCLLMISECRYRFPSGMDTNRASGAIHTVMMAPEGVGLRFVPFSLDVPVGDTVRYIWTTPANHTVTLSSALAPCNKSGIADQRNFSSGVRSGKNGQQTCESTLRHVDLASWLINAG